MSISENRVNGWRRVNCGFTYCDAPWVQAPRELSTRRHMKPLPIPLCCIPMDVRGIIFYGSHIAPAAGLRSGELQGFEVGFGEVAAEFTRAAGRGFNIDAVGDHGELMPRIA